MANAIMAALKDESWSDKSGCVNEAAAMGLAHITGKSFGEDQVAWDKYREENKEAFLSVYTKGLCRY